MWLTFSIPKQILRWKLRRKNSLCSSKIGYGKIETFQKYMKDALRLLVIKNIFLTQQIHFHQIFISFFASEIVSFLGNLSKKWKFLFLFVIRPQLRIFHGTCYLRYFPYICFYFYHILLSICNLTWLIRRLIQ